MSKYPYIPPNIHNPPVMLGSLGLPPPGRPPASGTSKRKGNRKSRKANRKSRKLNRKSRKARKSRKSRKSRK